MFRSLPLFSTLAMLTLLAFSPCWGATPSDAARQALEKSISHVLELIKDPAYAVPGTRPAVRQRIETEVRHIFNFEEFSSRTVGAPWRDFSAAQKTDFSAAFADLLIATYLDKINGYNGEQISYTGEVASTSGDRVEVRTHITLKDGKVIPVAYRMLPRDTTWCVYDVLIENISLVKNYRTQFQDILSKGTPLQLIDRVRERAHALQEKVNAIP